MTADFRDDIHDARPARPPSIAPRPKPKSPVEELDWRDEDFEGFARGVNDKHGDGLNPDLLDDLLEQVDSRLSKLPGVLAEIADIEAEWRSINRPWFRWGISEVDAERAAVRDYRAVLDRTKSILSKKIKARNKQRNDEARRAALERAQAERAERRARHEQRMSEHEAARIRKRDALEPVSGEHLVLETAEMTRLRRQVMTAAFRLAEAPAEQWSPDSPLGLRLRAAVSEYEETKDDMVLAMRQEGAGG